MRFGGADRDRTGDPLVANQVLSQLSYSPLILVGLDRLELSTSPLSGVRSSHLSYRPYLSCQLLVTSRWQEPTTSLLKLTTDILPELGVRVLLELLVFGPLLPAKPLNWFASS